MWLDQERAERLMEYARLEAAKIDRVQPFVRDARLHERGPARLETGTIGFVERDLERSRPRVLHPPSASFAHLTDERVKQGQTASRQIQKAGVVMRLDVRRENAGRGGRRASSRTAHVEYRHRGATSRKRVGDRDTDNATANDDDSHKKTCR